MQIPESVMAEAFVERDGETVRFYYLRNKKNQPVAAVCILRDENYKVYYRGVAFCSESEIFNKRTGRFLALQRARCSQAIRGQDSYGNPKERRITKYPEYVNKILDTASHKDPTIVRAIQPHGGGGDIIKARKCVPTDFEKNILGELKVETEESSGVRP